ncbi:hypothetical protein M501DRAFT_1014600 [Patellaria atrata CBS 101060]|uniref:Protein-lysine N-methyltransferase EFM6 n=1 Tax=Patellaria atrata CBS 101060 TaxID=1346257 RepID=A0A9P4SFD5_9PEZI|nr:hypothetical protein M501DRAFT_1014600 [Patellaria atrata CBS 101060]
MDDDPETENAFNIGEELVQSPDHKRAGISVVDFDGLLPFSLRLEEDLKEGCGGQLWPAGMVLSKYLLRQSNETFKNRSIVELGAGGGLVGLSLALKIKADGSIFITDQKPMYELMEKNISLNSLDDNVKAAIYDWGSPVPPSIPQHPDIVLAADCVYFEPAFPLLQQTLNDLIGSNTVCYFCFKKRRRADLHFIKVARKMFKVKEIANDPDKPVYSRENIYLYELRKK